MKNRRRRKDETEMTGTMIGVQLANGDKYIGKFVRASINYIWLLVKEYPKPVRIPKVATSRMLVSLPGGKGR